MKLGESEPRRIQRFINTKKVEEEFTFQDSDPSNNIRHIIELINCITKLPSEKVNHKTIYVRIHDPNKYVSPKLGGKLYPGSCQTCHYAKGNTAGCLILENFQNHNLIFP